MHHGFQDLIIVLIIVFFLFGRLPRIPPRMPRHPIPAHEPLSLFLRIIRRRTDSWHF